MRKKNQEITLKDILSIFIPKIWLIAAVAVICSLGLGLRTMFMTPDTYTASAIFHVKSGDYNLSSVNDSMVAVDNVKYIVKSSNFCLQVVSDVKEKDANFAFGSGNVASAISYQPLDNAMLKISVTTTNQKNTFNIAQSLKERIPLAFTNFAVQGKFTAEIIQDFPDKVQYIGVNAKNTVKNAIIGFVIGTAVSAIGVFVYSLLDSKIRTKKKLEDNFDLQVLGTLPIITAADEPIVLGIESSASRVEAFNSLCSNLIYLPIESKCKKIAITSAKEGEEKSMLATNLAIALSENLRDKKVLFIDSDMRDASASRLISSKISDLENGKGLSDFLSGGVDEPTFIATSISNLSVLLAGDPTSNPASLICSAKAGELFAICEEKFDYVIIDTPPVNAVSDAVLLINRVDGYILSTKAKTSTVSALELADKTLSAVGAKIYGTVLSDVK